MWWLFYCEGILTPFISMINIKKHFPIKNNSRKNLHFQLHCQNFSFDTVENWIKCSNGNKITSKGMISKYYNPNGCSKLQNRYRTVISSILSFFWILQQQNSHPWVISLTVVKVIPPLLIILWSALSEIWDNMKI